ncbi:MAG: plastocyanin [Nodosilinea sp.]
MKHLIRVAQRLGIALLSVLLLVGTLTLVSAPASATNYNIKMGSDAGLLKFEPDTVTVKPGDTVTWVNNKMAPHNVVFEPKSPADKALADAISHTELTFTAGQKYSTAFTEDMPAGTYTYFCAPHRGAGMAAKVILEK